MRNLETKVRLLENVHKELGNIGGIEQSATVSRDGLIIYSSKEKAEAFAAMVAVTLGAAENSLAELGKGVPEISIVKNSICQMVIIGAGSKALLAIIAEPDAGLGLILLEMEKSAQKIKEILG